MNITLWFQYIMRKMGMKIAVKTPSITKNVFLYPPQGGDVLTDGDFTNTLVFLADNCPDGQRKNAIKYHQRVRANSIILNACNTDGSCPTTPYVNMWGGEFNDGKLKKWKNWCIECLYADLVPIMSFICVESPGDVMAKPSPEHERCIQKLVSTLDDVVGMWVVGWEASKFWSPAYTNEIAGIFKKYTKKPVGVHNQGVSHGTGDQIDFLALENSWNPRTGDKHSDTDCANQIKDAINRLGKTVIAGEYNTNSSGDTAKNQGAMALTVGAKGAWNGWR